MPEKRSFRERVVIINFLREMGVGMQERHSSHE